MCVCVCKIQTYFGKRSKVFHSLPWGISPADTLSAQTFLPSSLSTSFFVSSSVTVVPILHVQISSLWTSSVSPSGLHSSCPDLVPLVFFCPCGPLSSRTLIFSSLWSSSVQIVLILYVHISSLWSTSVKFSQVINTAYSSQIASRISSFCSNYDFSPSFNTALKTILYIYVLKTLVSSTIRSLPCQM